MAFKWAKENGIHKVFYPGNTFCATYSAAIETGVSAKPFDQSGSREAMHNRRVNMHYGGVKDETPCLIEDSAHRIEPNDPLVGKIRCYSFYATKNMTTGSGGMFVTNDKDIYERARLFWRDGLTTSTADRAKGFSGYEVRTMAGGYDGNDIAAALGRVQLRHLPEFTKRRNEIVARYNAGLKQSWTGNHLYCSPVNSEEEVYTLINYMQEKGVSCSHHYPGTGWANVSLPIYPLITDNEVDYIIECLKEWYEKHPVIR
jgi:perosamine synthetase